MRSWSGAYIRAGRYAGRGAPVGESVDELEGPGRDNVVVAASGLVRVGGIDELCKDVPNSEDIVT